MLEFEWDVSKEACNILKHGVNFTDAAGSFLDPKGIQLFDKSHSSIEQRFFWTGKAPTGRIITTWFTSRGSKIRIIGSAELRKFKRIYENTKIT